MEQQTNSSETPNEFTTPTHISLWWRTGALVAQKALWVFTVVFTGQSLICSANIYTQTVTRFAEQAEWTLTNSTFFGNPYDVLASVSFVHEETGEKRVTEMFYDGEDRWRFRFTGTQLGIWQFSTTSADPELHGHSGEIQVNPAPPGTKGFLIAVGQKFARQTETGDPEAVLFNVYMNERDFPPRDIANWDDSKTDSIISEAAQYGFNAIFVHVNNQWFSLGNNAYTEHSSENPDLETFRILERIIRRAHSQGFHVQIWAWGDEERKWTPPGGINRIPDRRLQHYIAARLGPLPGWSMSYGFDLHEWVTEEEIESWAFFLRSRLGWPHLLWARNRFNGELDVKSHPGYHVRSYDAIVSDIESDPTRPHLYEERHTYHRESGLDMTGTRRFLWDLTMAGGAGCWWGFFERPGDEAPPYDNPEMLLTHASFWKGRFHLDLLRDHSLGDSRVLRSPNFKRLIFYKEDTGSMEIDLSGASEPLRVIAVNTLTHYEEIELGVFSNAQHTIALPEVSDWAIAVGEFTQPSAIGGFTTWALELPEGQRQELDDPDGDLLNNFVEYSLGGSPQDALNASGLTKYFSFSKTSESFMITLKNPARSDVDYEVQRSQILNPPTWSAIAEKVAGSDWQALLPESVITSDINGTHVSDQAIIAGGAFYQIVVRKSEFSQ